MSFATRLEEVAHSDDSRDNVLTDGQLTLSYAELPKRLAAIHNAFTHWGVERNECLAFECPNTVTGALTLLYLLQQELSFVLLPPSEQGEQPSEWKPIPHFCRQRLVVCPYPTAVSAEWLETPADYLWLEANRDYRPATGVALAAPGYLFLRTSGSMGTSKLVVHEQHRLIENAGNCVYKYDFTTSDRVLVPVPIAHMYGLGAEFLPAVLAGAAIYVQDRMNLIKYLKCERKFRPTIAFVTPTICDMLLRGFRSPRLGYKVIVTSGQRISEELFRSFDNQINHRLVNQYGSSEMGAIAACDPDDPQDLKATSIGKPMRNVELMLERAIDKTQSLSPQADQVEDSLLYCRHPHSFSGYVNEAGEWLYRTDGQSWYNTGDLAYRLANGYLEVTGRAGNSVNRRGYLVHFAEIEQRIESMREIHQVVVVRATGESPQGERIAAFCVLDPGTTLNQVQIRERCFERLPVYTIPDDIFIVEQLPLLASGKIDRQRLMRMTQA